MRFKSWIGAGTVISGLALLASGCAVGSADDEEAVSEAREAQVDPGFKDYLVYNILDTAGSLKGKVLVTATSGGGYTANREYWYMSSNLSNTGTYTFSGGTSQYWSTPPSGLGTLSFVTQRTPTWTTGTPSGTMLRWTSVTGGEKVAIDWNMSVSHGSWFGSITWWHSNTNNLFGDGTSTTLSSGTPSSGTWYSFTTSPL